MGERIPNQNPSRPLVCIVDDDASVRKHIKRQLRLEGWEVEAFDSSDAFLDFPLPPRPTCLLLDVRLAGTSGIDLYGRLRQREIPPSVVFLTGFGRVHLATRAMKEGAVDFLEKPVRRNVLLAAVRTALELSRHRLMERSELRSLEKRYQLLTPRERDVMDYVVSGRLNKQTALDLGITEATIKVHRARVMQKMGADSVASLTLMALSLGRIHRAPTPTGPPATASV
jgi:FixJ family two-component response regulator